MTRDEVIQAGLRLQEIGLSLQRQALRMEEGQRLTPNFGWRDVEEIERELEELAQQLYDDRCPGDGL